MLWMGLMYCFWRMGTYLPGVPAPVEGIFKMKQVSKRGMQRPATRGSLQHDSHSRVPCGGGGGVKYKILASPWCGS